MSIHATHQTAVALFDSVTGLPLALPVFASGEEAAAFLEWQQDASVWSDTEQRAVEWDDLRALSAAELEAVATVWGRVWKGMAANPDHQHNPGCSYRAECRTCGWASNWGDSDNAHSTGWDHRKDAPQGEERSTYDLRHKVESVHQ
jgi:hypothetical protein